MLLGYPAIDIWHNNPCMSVFTFLLFSFSTIAENFNSLSRTDIELAYSVSISNHLLLFFLLLYRLEISKCLLSQLLLLVRIVM